MAGKDNVIEPEVLGPDDEQAGNAQNAGPAGGSPGAKDGAAGAKKKKAATKGQKIFWGIVALLSGLGFAADMIMVTPEDIALPVIGWLDEGMLGTIFLVALGRLGIEIPFLSRMMGGKAKEE